MTDRRLKILLVASLAINVFLIGGAAGALAIWGVRKAEVPKVEVSTTVRRPAAAARPPLRFAANDLAPAQRQAFREALRAARREVAPQQAEARRQRGRLNELLVETNPDKAAIAAAMAQARQADLAVRARVETTVADFAAGLSPEDRAVFVAGLRRSGTLRATGNPPATR